MATIMLVSQWDIDATVLLGNMIRYGYLSDCCPSCAFQAHSVSLISVKMALKDSSRCQDTSQCRIGQSDDGFP